MSRDQGLADHRLDVREIEGEPFGDIMNALDELDQDETLLLLNSFEPVPLYDVLEDRGFEYEAENPEPETWHITISRTGPES
ncbi:MAG: DUF2249 domain-containing protein [Halodesulfurarchaeum sp.]